MLSMSIKQQKKLGTIDVQFYCIQCLNHKKPRYTESPSPTINIVNYQMQVGQILLVLADDPAFFK